MAGHRLSGIGAGARAAHWHSQRGVPITDARANARGVDLAKFNVLAVDPSDAELIELARSQR